MRHIISITKAKYLGGFNIELTFSDAVQNIVNFEEFVGNSKHPDLKKYLKIQNFKKFKIVSGNLVWGDFEMIFPITDLYEGVLVKKYQKNQQESLK